MNRDTNKYNLSPPPVRQQSWVIGKRANTVAERAIEPLNVDDIERVVGENGFEMMTTAEFNTARRDEEGVGWRKLRREFEDRIKYMSEYPNGYFNIDYRQHDHPPSSVIHAFAGDLGKLSPSCEIVIKSRTGIDDERATLRNQFLRSVAFQRAFDKMRELDKTERFKHLHVAHVYGYLSHGTGKDIKEYILMERASGEPLPHWLAFHREEEHEPNLRQILNYPDQYNTGIFAFGALADEISQAIQEINPDFDETVLNDLRGDNVVKSGLGAKAEYTLIDIGGTDPA
jgi:hypothetical protein